MAVKPFIGLLSFLTIFSCSLDSGIDGADNNSGILLSFDDYHEKTWRDSFALFEKYDAKVTFFVNLENPTPFCFDAQAKGHEIGYHTVHHPDLTAVTREVFFEETIEPIDRFGTSGVQLVSFAYPGGEWKGWMHQELLKCYKIVRGFDAGFHIYDKGDIKNRYISSVSIDNIKYKSDEEFRDDIMRMLKIIKAGNDSIIPLTSHAISDDDWGIKKGRLEYLLRKCAELNVRFYRYRDFSE
jgi:peptidoglycan/xylan/chitin deacetylase (PgdA/CDA1 family)